MPVAPEPIVISAYHLPEGIAMVDRIGGIEVLPVVEKVKSRLPFDMYAMQLVVECRVVAALIATCRVRCVRICSD